ncbi:hypothetical protein UlMin_042143 [Ulmus minor]
MSLVPLNSSADLGKVKNEPAETDSNLKSLQPLVSDQTIKNKSDKPLGKRKEREKKASRGQKSKNEHEDAEKLPYVHVRDRRGQATDSHSFAERVISRKPIICIANYENINARMKLLHKNSNILYSQETKTIEIYIHTIIIPSLSRV